MDLSKAPNLNYLWCGLLVEELIRQGVAGFVISPGSRSAPLTVSVARNEKAKYWVHYDERGAAFFALGLAKATGKPAVLICTSGSAVANYWPAVVEAAMSQIPLILLTADRPPELVDCGANQAIDQTDIFGDYARWRTALPCPTAECPATYVLTTADQAWHRSQHPQAGPVHVNVPLREPLDPKPDQSVTDDVLKTLVAWAATDAPYTHYDAGASTVPDGWAAPLLEHMASARNKLLIVGRLHGEAEHAAVRKLAKLPGWKIYADITSGLYGPSAPAGLVQDMEHFLQNEAWQPDLVLHLGGAYTSKRLLTHMADWNAPYIHVSASEQRLDPNHQVTQHLTVGIASFCQWLQENAPKASVSTTTAIRTDASPAVEQEWSERGIAHQLGSLLPENSLLFAGNSMPIRLLERFCRPERDGIHVVANRGASGIDGNIATALGMASGTGQATTALLGDLTTLHDLNSLALHQAVKTPLVLIVLNNDGGGIFHHLPIARADEPCFEQCFGTPHGMDFSGAAQQFGLDYAAPEDPDSFRESYLEALATGRATLIEIKTPRFAGQGDAETNSASPKNEAEAPPEALRPIALAGDPKNPPLLLIHGFMGNVNDWDKVAEACSATHHVLGVNLPGHSPDWAEVALADFDMDRTARGLLVHLDALGIGACSLLGYSMGGRFALYLATQYPERFTRVILESASPGLDTAEKQHARQVQDGALAERLCAMGAGSDAYREFLEAWYDLPLFESLRRHPELRTALIQRRVAENAPPRLGEALGPLGTGKQPNLWPALAHYTTPTLLLVGEQDRKYRMIAEDMCAACPAMAMEVFADCGHIAHLEKSDAFLTTVRGFLAHR